MPDSRKKILFLLTRPPYPANDGTKQKIMSNILDAVQGEFDCTLAIISDIPPDPGAITYLKERYGKVNYFYDSRARRGIQGLRYWLAGYPLQTGFFYSKGTARALRTAFEDADVIYAHTLRFGKYLEDLPSNIQKKVLFDFNDAISYNYRNATHYASGWWRMIYATEASRIAHYEQKMLSYPFTFSIVCEADKKYLKDDRINVVRHGVPDELLSVSNDHNGALNAVFMGNMFYPPNLDAIQWLARFFKMHDFQGISGNLLDAVGRYPQGLSKKYPQVSFAGFVDDPHAFIVRHRFFMAPLRFGAGVQTKVLEAMALGMPVITTPEGARGIDGAENGKNIILIDINNEARWVDEIARIYGDLMIRQKIGNAARELIRSFNSSSNIKMDFRKLIEKVVS